MNFVYQTRHGNKLGNCLCACVASITGLPIEEVDFDCRGNDWLDQYNKKMIKKHDKWLFCVNITDHKLMHGVYIAIGDSVDLNCDHAVLWQDGKMVFDPYKHGKGLKGKPNNFMVIVDYVE